MTERRKDILALAALLALLILFFSKILFTHQVIRAPDILNEFYWGVKGYNDIPFFDLFKIRLQADWDMLVNGGTTNEGGAASMAFLIPMKLVFHFFPAPANVAWFIVLQLFFGAAGMYACCRLIGTSRFGAFFAGALFALAPEIASLINAGHVMKIATISYAPWAFYCFEKGFQRRRVFWFMTAALVLAFQFFNTHWQIAYYTCLCIGVYGVARSLGILNTERSQRQFFRLFGLNLVTMVFFLSTVAISLAPLTRWSVESTRGVQSGANTGKGGMAREEAMAWSLPPEELATFVIPGLFGLSRQEAGPNPANIDSYYWGRMVFTQTSDYMGLIPWLLLPLPLIFRRDRYTWLALLAIGGGILFSMGKYSWLYQLLYDFFPGINRFRVPKMMMFIPVMGLGVLAARGIDLLRDEEVRQCRAFRRYLAGIVALPVFLAVILALEKLGQNFWLATFFDSLSRPTRYEEGAYLVAQRWNNLLMETIFATIFAAASAALIYLYQKGVVARKLFPICLLALFVADVGRVNAKFMFLVDEPVKVKGGKSPAMEFVKRDSRENRTLPMNDGDPMQYVSQGIPVMFTSNPVQQRRWQEFLDAFAFNSSMPDIMNVKYLVYTPEKYAQDRAQIGDKYQPVFQAPDGKELVLENRSVLPKAWLVPTVSVIANPQQMLAVLQSPLFNAAREGLVESLPPIPMRPGALGASGNAGEALVDRYEANHITLRARAVQNALLVMGEKYYKGWHATVDGKAATIYPVDHVLRGVYLTPGEHRVEFVFDPLPFKVGKWLTLASFAFFAMMAGREIRERRKSFNHEA